jgi:hypothetical protein
VADRPIVDGRECIRFVVDTNGSAKVLKRRYWGGYIRLPAVDVGNVDKICNGDYFGNDYSGVVNVEVNDSCGTLDKDGYDRKKSNNLIYSPVIKRRK